MKISHFLSIDLAYLNDLSSIELTTLNKIVERGKIHEIGSINTNINTINKMNTLLIPPNGTKYI